MRLLRFLFSRLFICLVMIAALIAAIVFLCVYIHSLLPAAAAICLSYLLSMSAALYLLANDGAIDFKFVWLALIIAFPIGGAVLCLLSHVCARKGKSAEIMPAAECSVCEFFDDGAKFLKRLTELISLSQKSVYLEFYIISKGHIWGDIFNRLQLALARGVEVKIIYDSWGSAVRAPKKDFKTLTAAGAQIKVFNKLSPLPVSRINLRDHRKIAVIDGQAVFIGGVNVADEYAHLVSPHAFWKDGGALFYGQTATRFSELFLRQFGEGDDGFINPKESPPPPLPYPSSAALNGGYNGVNAQKASVIREKFTVLPVADAPDGNGGIFEDEVAAAVYGAKKRVHIFTPYLCAGEKLCGALAYAARRGVDVAIIIPAVPDKRLPFAITRTYAEKLIRKGVAVYEYTPGFMHFKGAVFDDTAYIGSYNLDFRSTRLNFENGVFCTGGICQELENDFIACLALSRPKAARKDGALRRLYNSLLCLFAPLI